ncbi:ATP-binding cassette, subfamily B [Halomicrobium zhouii]|uniref:ATP-binding cassette, subfamily B n=1 Tax=Halomicrobium zhouii TaxID=767519 RepID=A0A1I6L2F4_9EURY|nr:ABC transporter ATP-binding protein [Halomicrobium zhouii]SFR97617.1 ATP-binding cassette, subfamily B [Halomicrobium zhouii]
MTREDRHPGIGTVHEEEGGVSDPLLDLLRRYVPGNVGVFCIAVWTTILHQLLTLVPPYLLGETLDAFFTQQRTSLSLVLVPQTWIPTGTRGQFVFIAGLFVATALATAITQAVQFVTFRWFQQSVLHDLRTNAFDATQRLDMAFFETEATGNVMSVLNNDVNQLRDFLLGGLRQFVESTTLLLGLLGFMIGLHWQLTVFSMSFLPLMLGLVYAYQQAIEPRYDDRRSAVGNLNAHVQNAIDGIETIKTFSTEHRERSELQTHSRTFWQADWRAAKVSGFFYSTRRLLTEVMSIAIVVVGGWWVLFGPPLAFSAPLTAGLFVTFLFYGRRLVKESSQIGDLVDTYTDARASAKRVFGLIQYPTKITKSADAEPLRSVDGHVEYDDVSFTYPNADSATLKDVSFEAQPGEFVGLVGPTGAGKSTALKLLLRLYDTDDGTITIDGTDVSTTTVASLREAVGYVSQDPFLFGGTVRENIAYSAPDASEERVIDAAKRANAHGFIRTLPDGYDTDVGERGVKLSGGQRQRITIARAILKEPPILILDEATSHVDTQTELLIQESLRDLVATRTTFVIAHQLSTIREADQLLVFRDGRIVESGDHEALVEQDGLYASLWRIHTGETAELPDQLHPHGR